MSLIEATGLRKWRQWLVRDARGRTLDIGCGTGRNLPLYSPSAQALGLDPSWSSLKRARARAPGAALVCGSAENLPFKAGVFDTVVSGMVFCSVPRPEQGLAEIKRVLQPTGTMRMLEHVRSAHRLGARWQDFIQPAWTCVMGGCFPNRDTEATVELSGFRIEDRRANGNMRRFVAHPI